MEEVEITIQYLNLNPELLDKKPRKLKYFPTGKCTPNAKNVAKFIEITI